MEKERKRRQRRVSQMVHETVSRLLIQEMTDPLLAWVNITGVEMTPDLRNARVFFCIFGESDENQVIRALTRVTPGVQRRVGDLLKLRNTPVLTFQFDNTSVEAARIDHIVEEIALERKQNAIEETPSQRVGRVLSAAKQILICAHAKPDGDAVGSMLAMMYMAEGLGKQTIVYCPDPIPSSCLFLPGVDRIQPVLKEDESPDVTFMLDVADPVQFPVGLPDIQNMGHVVVIDHHSVYGAFGDTVIREEASATGEILYRLATTLLWPVDRNVAVNLYTAIVADTGSFRHSNATSSAFQIAASLVDEGVRPDEVADHLYGNVDVERQKLLGTVLGTLCLHMEGRISSMICTQRMMAQCEASANHLEGVVQFGREIRGVDVALLCVEDGDVVKVGFRSTARMDVAALAARFGGGGHPRASGATFVGVGIDEVRRTVVAEIERDLSGRRRTG